jgi:hypothetical protein
LLASSARFNCLTFEKSHADHKSISAFQSCAFGLTEELFSFDEVDLPLPSSGGLKDRGEGAGIGDSAIMALSTVGVLLLLTVVTIGSLLLFLRRKKQRESEVALEVDDEPDEFLDDVSGGHSDGHSGDADWGRTIPEFSLGMEEGRSWLGAGMAI